GRPSRDPRRRRRDDRAGRRNVGRIRDAEGRRTLRRAGAPARRRGGGDFRTRRRARAPAARLRMGVRRRLAVLVALIGCSFIPRPLAALEPDTVWAGPLAAIHWPGGERLARRVLD